MNLNLTADSVGERLIVAVVLLGLVAEMLSDNWPPVTMDPEWCVDMCHAQAAEVAVVALDRCECRGGVH